MSKCFFPGGRFFVRTLVFGFQEIETGQDALFVLLADRQVAAADEELVAGE